MLKGLHLGKEEGIRTEVGEVHKISKTIQTQLPL
jgi:hypothetical protein